MSRKLIRRVVEEEWIEDAELDEEVLDDEEDLDAEVPVRRSRRASE